MLYFLEKRHAANFCFSFRSKLYRQTVILSSLVSPELNALFNKHCHNILEQSSILFIYYFVFFCVFPVSIQECNLHKLLNSVASGRFEWNVVKVIFKLPNFRDKWLRYLLWHRSQMNLLDLTDDNSTLGQVMAWCRQASTHCLSQCWPRFMSPMTLLHWVNGRRSKVLYQNL